VIENQNDAVVTTQLAAHLYKKSIDRGQGVRELALELGISYVYLTKLLRTPDAFAHANRRIYVAVSQYLELPIVQCYLLGNALKPSDFLESQSNKESAADSFINAMRTDPAWSGFVPPPSVIDQLDHSTKTLLALLYQKHLAITLA